MNRSVPKIRLEMLPPVQTTRPLRMSSRCSCASSVRNSVPLVIKVPSLPPQLPGSRVELTLGAIDLVDLEIDARYVKTLAEPSLAESSGTEPQP